MLVWLQIVAIVAIVAIVVGVATVARFHIFAAVDEEAHLAYVQEVAEHGRLPWLGRTVLPTQLQPHHVPGFAGLSYEAFQPPLYYVLAVPAFDAASSVRGKVFALRAFDLLLLLLGVALLALLARAVLGRRWLIGFSLALSVLLWPGVIVRAITISNAALEIPIVALYLLVLWHASTRPRPVLLVAAGGVLGLCVLTQLTLVCLAPLLLAPLIALLRGRRDRRAWMTAAVAVALPLLLLAPWVVSNEQRYGALTASALASREQAAYFGLTGRYPPASEVIAQLWPMARAALPQEWWPEYSKTPLGILLRILPLALAAVVALPVMLRPRLLWSRASALLAAPFVLALLTLTGILALDETPTSLPPRYLNPMLAPVMLFAAWAWTRDRDHGGWLRVRGSDQLRVGVRLGLHGRRLLLHPRRGPARNPRRLGSSVVARPGAERGYPP